MKGYGPWAKEVSACARRYHANIQAELDRAAVYRAMSDVEPDRRLAESFRRLADDEERHAHFWQGRLGEIDGGDLPQRPSARARLLARLARVSAAGSSCPLPLPWRSPSRRHTLLQPEADDTAMGDQEREHERVLDAAVGASSTGVTAGILARLVGRRRGVTGNALRAAVLGANEGLVSNLSLVMGAAGASFSSRTVLITGLAGLLAGAFSMAMGEWVSVQSSRELNQRQLEVEADEIATDPVHERAELITLDERRGLTPGEAGALADRIMADKDTALDAMARDELGIDPEELGGSPWTAAIASLLLFITGAVVPVAPFVFVSGDSAVAISVAVSGLGLLGIGAAITLLTDRGVWHSAFRQLAIGLGAAAVTYGGRRSGLLPDDPARLVEARPVQVAGD